MTLAEPDRDVVARERRTAPARDRRVAASREPNPPAGRSNPRRPGTPSDPARCVGYWSDVERLLADGGLLSVLIGGVLDPTFCPGHSDRT
jgi:hypothetical protein